MTSKDFVPLFSVVVAFNQDDSHTERLIDSVIGQTLNFEDNVELVLVDYSEKIEQEFVNSYLDKYPKNIKIAKAMGKNINQARNVGARLAGGDLILFPSPQNTLSKNFLSETKDFFVNNEEVNIVTTRPKFYGLNSRNSFFSNTYTINDEIIDIENNPSINISLIGSCVFRIGLINSEKDLFRDDLSIPTGVELVSRLVEREKKFGILRNAKYIYTRRVFNSSIGFVDKANADWYSPLLRVIYGEHLDVSLLSEYRKELLLKDITYRLKQDRIVGISDEQIDEYRSSLKRIIGQIDDSILLRLKHFKGKDRINVLGLKYGDSVMRLLEFKKTNYYYSDRIVLSVKASRPSAVIELIYKQGGDLIVEGYVTNRIIDGRNVIFCVDGKQVEAFTFKRAKKDRLFLGRASDEALQFRVEIGVGESIKSLECWVEDGGLRSPVPFHSVATSRLSNHRFAYKLLDDVLIRRRKSNKLTVVESGNLRRLGYEIAYLSSVLTQLKIKHSKEIIEPFFSRSFRRALDVRGIKELVRGLILPIRSVFVNVFIVFFRVFAITVKPFKKQQIWLVSDRANMGGDNGDAFFQFLSKEKPEGVEVYFVLTKNSSDYDRISGYGSIVDPGSLKYKRLMLLADKVISSHANDIVMNAFGARKFDVIDLYTYKFIFLQHGIIMGDLSSWLNRYNRDIDIFVTSATPEYESIIEGEYYYTDREVKLTGLPRHDLLENNPQKKLIITPTWRRWLAKDLDQTTGERPYNHEFKQSQYFKFFINLLNDKRLVSVLDSAGMTGEFYLHPSLAVQVGDFSDAVNNKTFKIMTPPYKYSKAFSEGSILLTDHSSAAFDFTYMKKPLVYARFDTDEYYARHQAPGYFNYEKDGHGPVAETVEGAVDALIKIIENDCQTEDKYIKRIEKFFYKFDKENSRRVYESILSLDE